MSYQTMENKIANNTIFSTIVGSKAYGLDTKESDTDIRGIAVLSDLSYYYGFLNNFEQWEDKKEDTVIYDIRKAFKLMADANPNMLDLLFTDERFHIKKSKIFDKILDNRDKFLSKRVRFSYVGYAYAQLKRIKTARSWLLNPPSKKPERSDYGLPKEKFISKEDIGAFQWIMAHLLKDSLEYINLSDSVKEELENVNWIGLLQSKDIPNKASNLVQNITGASDEWMDLMYREKAYINAKRHYDSYINWKKNRNKKRAQMEEKFGFDGKHAAHLVRLLRMGKEILSGEGVILYRHDREELMSIRNGHWKYDELLEYAKDMEEQIIELYHKSDLPNKPDRVFLDSLCVDIVNEYINSR